MSICTAASELHLCRGGKTFGDTCIKAGLPDDATVGAVISKLLGLKHILQKQLHAC